MTAAEQVRAEVVGGVGWLRLVNPARRNALSHHMAEAMRQRLLELAIDRNVRALVITGDDAAFCAGVDLRDDPVEHDRPFAEVLELLIEEVRAFPVPTVAMVEGHCIGAGCALATACDVRFAHSDASFAVPGARMGIRYPTSALRRLVALVGPGRANRMLLSGERVSAEVASAWGLVDSCSDGVLDEVVHFVHGIRDVDPDVVRDTRDAIRSVTLLEAAAREGRNG